MIAQIKKISIYKNIFCRNAIFRSIYCSKIEYLSSYATKSDLKNATGVHQKRYDPSDFAKKAYLAGLKPDDDKLDIDELKSYV